MVSAEPLVESIVNVSESRPEAVRALAGTLAGVRLLDVHTDTDHNRSVFTLAGGPEAVEAAVLQLFDEALRRIDLRLHRGVHPRIGAVDVVPFVPIRGVTMADCVALARRVGKAVADRFGLPVFLYEDAATVPHRRRLENVRRGQFEGLAEKLRDPLWIPDFGPTAPHPSAGATVIGARKPLIAFNVNLATGDVRVAQSVARAVRESAGGLPGVKAMGVLLSTRGLAQVSMNLTDYERTPVDRAFHAVRTEAARHGVSVAGSELVGLVPVKALVGAAAGFLGIEGSLDAQILEWRMDAADSGPTTPGS
jgi:glutamate formiminotransferase / 5-formyltetrahydrofolate cyclo-ligase